MKSKFLLVLEIVWVIIGLACTAAGINSAVGNELKKSLIFFVMAAISFIFARIRHLQRKKL